MTHADSGAGGRSFCWSFRSPAVAQPLFANPLDSAAGYRAARGDTLSATHRFRYEITVTEAGKAPVVSVAVFDVAPDWALYSKDGEAVLQDFRLNRLFEVQDDSFTTVNGMASLVFRVMERQNRTYLGSMLSAAGANDMMSDCSSDAELGLSLPGAKSTSKIAVTNGPDGAVIVTCDGKETGRFTAGSDAAPAALWPTLFNMTVMHLTLFKRMRESGWRRSPLRR